MVNGPFRYAIGCFGLPLKLKHQDHGITRSGKTFGALLTNIYTRHAEQLLAGQSALVVWLYRRSWTIPLRIMIIVLYGETIAKPSGLEIALGRADF